MAMEQEKIYVVVPVYKVEPYLERCVESILNQTYDNYELILVDDGSPDNCPAICDQYSEKYAHITVIHQKNGGLSAARNAGIEYALAHGDPEKDWINFIDSDDFVHPRYLEYLYRAAKESGTDISCCNFIRTATSEMAELLHEKYAYCVMSPTDYWVKKQNRAILAWGKLYRVVLFHEIKYPVGKIHEDTATTYKLLFQQKLLAITDEPLYNWYRNPQSITLGGWTPAYMDILEVLEEQLVFFKNSANKKALKVSSVEYYKKSLNNLLCVKELSPKYDYVMVMAREKHKQALRICVMEAGFGAVVICWIKAWIMEQKELRKIVKKYYFQIKR